LFLAVVVGTRNTAVNRICDITRDLRKGEARVQDSDQLVVGTVDNTVVVNRLSVRPKDTILVDRDLPVLVPLGELVHFEDRELRGLCDILEALRELGDGHLAGERLVGIIAAIKKHSDVVLSRLVLAEDAIHGCITGVFLIELIPDDRSGVGAEANEPVVTLCSDIRTKARGVLDVYYVDM
jgi:hypothetical protein